MAQGLELIDLPGGRELWEKASKFVNPKQVLILGDRNLVMANRVHQTFKNADIVVIDRDYINEKKFKGEITIKQGLIQNIDVSTLVDPNEAVLTIAKDFFNFLSPDNQIKVIGNVVESCNMIFASVPPTKTKQLEKTLDNLNLLVSVRFSIGFMGIWGKGYGIEGKK